MPYRAGVLHNGSDDRLVIVCQVFYTEALARFSFFKIINDAASQVVR